MELIIILITFIATIIIYSMMKMDIKKLEGIALNPELKEITQKYPQNIEICKKILEKLNNTKTKIEQMKIQI